MSSSAPELFAEGNAAFRQGQWTSAAAAFAGTLQASVGHLKSRFRIADCLLNAGQKELALDVYKSLAWHCIKAGAPLHGLVAIKMALLLDPTYEDILYVLSELYASQSDRLDRDLKERAAKPIDDVPATALDDDDELLKKAALVAMNDRGEDHPEALPPIPFFSHLDEDAFLEILQKLRLRRFGDEELIVRQGDRSESVYIVADGDVLIKRNVDDDGGVTLAHLHQGAVFGEMALISDEPRTASVIAKGDVEILELRRSDLVVAAAHLRSVTDALKAFTRERFLRNLTATHPFFSPLSRTERHDVMDVFVPCSFDEGDTMIREGEVGSGLFLLLGGEAEVFKAAGDGDKVHLATLRGADLCGEMSLIGQNTTTASVVATERVEALFLSRDAFDALIEKHPELMKYLAGLTDERLRQNRALMLKKGLFEDDEHIMI